MSNPLKPLSRQPWAELVAAGAITMVVAGFLDLGIGFALAFLPELRGIVGLILSLGSLVRLAVGVGVGILAVWTVERFFAPQVRLDRASLWALVACVFLSLAIATSQPLPLSFLSLGYLQIVGILLGVFWKGRRYWQD